MAFALQHLPSEMLRRYTFIPVIFFLLAGLSWWTVQVRDAAQISVSGDELGSSQLRSDLVEVMDRLVAYEHYYRTVYGHYTKIIQKTGYLIPARVAQYFEVRVLEANEERLIVAAQADSGPDKLTVDQDFQLNSNFELPGPRLPYLRALAFRHARLLRDAPPGMAIEEESIFKGFFTYHIKDDPQSNRTAIALGIKNPVRGVQLEVGIRGENGKSDGDAGMELLKNFSAEYVTSDSSRPILATKNSLEEETYLAQTIFHGEMGRYAKDWSELERIAHFQFEGREQYPLPGPEAAFQHSSRAPSSQPQVSSDSAEDSAPLVVESISPQGDVTPQN